MRKLVEWIDARLPVVDAFERHMSKYYAPKNFNAWYFLDRCPCWFWSTNS